MKCTLKDIVISIQTGPFGSQLHRSDYSDTGIPVIMPQDIINWRISTEKIAYVSQYHVDRLSKHKLEYNDILYPRRGDVSKCAKIGSKETGWLCGTGCLKVKIDADKANPQYIFYYLQQPEIGKWIELHSTGATMMNINSSTLNDLPLNIPTIDIQNKICSIISQYDRFIDNCQKQISLLEETVQRLYKDWFVDLRFPGHESATIDDSLPDGWKEIPLKDVILYEIGGGWGEEVPLVNKDQRAYVIRSTDFAQLNNGIFNQLPNRYHGVGELKSRQLEPNDVIFEVSGGSKTEGVGKTYFITEDFLRKLNQPVICASFCKLIRFRDVGNALYYFDTLQYWRINGDTSVYDKRSASNIVNFNWKAFLSQKLIKVPSEDILNKYIFHRDALQKKIRNLQFEISDLTIARDTLLPRLMSGEIEIKI